MANAPDLTPWTIDELKAAADGPTGGEWIRLICTEMHRRLKQVEEDASSKKEAV